MDDDNAEYERWTQPLDLPTFGEFTAQWLEGSGWSPWQCGSPADPETAPLVSYLGAMNRGGFVTDFSQPGELGDGWAQRAAVSGYCAEAQAECLASLTLASDLVVIVNYPCGEATYEIPVTREGQRTHTILAGHMSHLLGDLWEGIHADTVSMLRRCHYVEIFDPQWGRDELLWPSVVAALGRDPGDCAGSLIDPDAFSE